MVDATANGRWTRQILVHGFPLLAIRWDRWFFADADNFTRPLGGTVELPGSTQLIGLVHERNYGHEYK